MLKRKIKVRTHQRRIGRKKIMIRRHNKYIRKNFGSKMFRDQIRMELYGDPARRESKLNEIKKSIKSDPLLKDIKFIDDPAVGQRKIIKVIEKNPDLLKDLRGADILVYESYNNVPPGFSKPKKGIIGVHKKRLDFADVDFDPFTRSLRVFTPENILKHEIAHLKSGKTLENLGFNEKEEYDPVRELALAELASDYAMHSSIRKETIPKKISDELAFKFLSRVENKSNPRSS